MKMMSNSERLSEMYRLHGIRGSEVCANCRHMRKAKGRQSYYCRCAGMAEIDKTNKACGAFEIKLQR